MLADEEDAWYYGQPEFKELLDRYEQAMRQGASIYLDADELSDIAEYYMTQNRVQDADKAISLAVALHPDSVEPQVFLARKQLFLDNPDEARRISQRIVDQEDREVKFLNAEILIKEERDREANDYLKREYKKIDEGKADFLYDSAALLTDYGMWEYALTWSNKLVRLFPTYHKANQQKAEILVCLGRYSDAIPVLTKVLDAEPYHKDMWNLLAEAQGATGHYAEALDAVEYVLAIDKDDILALATKAGCMYHMNQPDKAHELYLRYLNAVPEDGHVTFLDALCLSTMNRFDDAAKQLDRALSLSTPDSENYCRMLMEKAVVESKRHRADNALEAIAFAENMRQGEADAEYYLLKGQVQLACGFDDEAKASFDDAMRVTDDKCRTLWAIALGYGDAERYAEAIQTLLVVKRRYPKRDVGISPLSYLAYYSYRMGDKETGLTYLRDAAKVDRLHTEQLFSFYYPGVTPDEYYLYAYRDLYGHFPEEDK